MVRNLIISTGDCSDFDGFLALPLYYKAALVKGETDVAFIMNYPAYFNPTKNTVTYSAGEITHNTGDLRRPDAVVAGLGLGYNYDLKVFLEAQKQKQRQADADKRAYYDSYFAVREKFEKIPDLLFRFASDHGILDDLPKGDNGLTIPDYIVEKCILTYTAFKICTSIWNLCKDVIKAPRGVDPPNLRICVGGTNDMNPFSALQVKNEIAVYNQAIGLSNVSASDLLMQFKNVTTLSTTINSAAYEYIYIDMNGSMAWFRGQDAITLMNNRSKVIQVFVMGGVLSYSQVNTIGATPFLNRLSCATMNQLYHRKRTFEFFDAFKEKLVFISNNEINANFNFVAPQNVNDTPFYDSLKELYRTLFGPTPKTAGYRALYEVIYNSFTAFYDSRTGDRKPFDVIPSLALCEYILNGNQIPHYQTLQLIYDNKYGITILGSNCSEVKYFPKQATYAYAVANIEEFKVVGMNEKGENNPNNPYVYPLYLEKTTILTEVQSSITSSITSIKNRDRFLIYPVKCVFATATTQSNVSEAYITGVKKIMGLASKRNMQDVLWSFNGTELDPSKQIRQKAAGGAGSSFKKSAERIEYKNRMRVVYLGKRNAKYIKISGDYVSIRKLIERRESFFFD